jgi:hypothetical protein
VLIARHVGALRRCMHRADHSQLWRLRIASLSDPMVCEPFWSRCEGGLSFRPLLRCRTPETGKLATPVGGGRWAVDEETCEAWLVTLFAIPCVVGRAIDPNAADAFGGPTLAIGTRLGQRPEIEEGIESRKHGDQSPRPCLRRTVASQWGTSCHWFPQG